MSARAARALISLVALVGYAAVAWAAGSFYPFSTFPMYAEAPRSSRAARLGARVGGEVVEVTEFRAFDCDARIEPAAFDAACGRAYAPEYLDAELSHHVNARARELASGEPIEIVRRVWTIAPDGTIAEEDCVLARCSAAR